MACLEYFDEAAKNAVETICEEFVALYNDEGQPENRLERQIEQINAGLLRWTTPPILIDPFDENPCLRFDVDFSIAVLNGKHTTSYVVAKLYLFNLPARPTADSQRLKVRLLQHINEINMEESGVKFEYDEGDVESGVPPWFVVVGETENHDDGSIAKDELRIVIQRVLESASEYCLEFETFDED